MEENIFLTEISKEEVDALKRASAYSLPDSPADHGLRAARVKPAFYQFLTDGKYSLVALLQRIIEEANKALISLQGEVGTKANEESVSAALGLKANAEDVEKGFADVEEELGSKANETYVNEQLELKANATYDAISALLGIATAERAGAMSAEQAQQLSVLVDVMENEGAKEGFVSTIHEALKVLESVSEGANIAEILSEKVDKPSGGGTSVVYTNDSTGNVAFKRFSRTLINGLDSFPLRDGATQTFEVGAPKEDSHPVRLVDLNTALGDIEGALDEIIAQQAALIGGTV